MNAKELQAKVDALGAGPTKRDKWWYHPVDFGNGVKSHSLDQTDEQFYGRPDFGINKWNNYIKPFLPINLDGKNVVDLGCNCGIYSALAAKEGADVFAIEADPGNNGFYDQAVLYLGATVPELNISLLRKRASEIIWPDVDLVFAFNILYWLGDKVDIVLERLSERAEWIMVMGDEDIRDKPLARLSPTVEKLSNYFSIEKAWLPGRIEGGRNFNIIIGKKI